jgi:protocatechuate 4,5-dioxygenase, alpha chain
MTSQINKTKQVHGNYTFTPERAHQGYRFNKFCMSLTKSENRDAFKADEEAFMTAQGLSEAEKKLVHDRDFLGMIKSGGNIYMIIKIGAVTGHHLYMAGAQQRGETLEEFLATRNAGGAV